jgi:hypothetical protein
LGLGQLALRCTTSIKNNSIAAFPKLEDRWCVIVINGPYFSYGVARPGCKFLIQSATELLLISVGISYLFLEV